MIAIIGAMQQEVAELKNRMENPQVSIYAGMEFYSGKLAGREVVLVQSGVGKVNMASCTQILIDRFQADAVINTGVAGSLDARISIGDIVIGTDAVQHDMDSTVLGDAPGQILGEGTTFFPTDDALAQLAEEANAAANPDIRSHRGRVASGDQFIADRKKKDWIVNTFGAICCEMEGAAMAHVAMRNGVPCLILRAISDSADNQASMSYEEFQPQAIRHLVNLLLEMLGRM